MTGTISEADARVRVAAGRWLVLTGAGMSVDSGVPPFRGAGGLWERMDPERYAHVHTLETAPERAWELFRLLGRAIAGARPHAGHAALAAAEAAGRVSAIATQNIDGLHQAAGSDRVIELHGSSLGHYCHRCGKPAAEAAVAAAFEDDAAPVPRCACGGVLRPAITLFGEQLPDGALDSALRELMRVRRLLVVGTSCEVYPAALLPDVALERGFEVLVIGPDPTRLSAQPGVLWLHGIARERLPALFADGEVAP